MLPNLLSADVFVAIANFGLAIVWWPLLCRDWRRGYCHIPLSTSIPKTLLLLILFVGELWAGLPIAAAVCWIDIVAWLLLMHQRITLGDGSSWQGGWWCPWCDEAVAGEFVTNDQRHDPRAGGCGRKVVED